MESMVRVSGSMPEGWWSVEVDDGELAAWDVRSGSEVAGGGGRLGWRLGSGGDGRLEGKVEEEDVVDGRAAFEGVGGVLEGVLGYETSEESAGAGCGLFRQRDIAVDEGDGAVAVVGHGEADGFAGGRDGRCERGLILVAGELFPGLLASAEQDEGHEQTGDGEDPEEDALVAGDHRAPIFEGWADWAWGSAWSRQAWRAEVRAAPTRCW